MKNKVIKSIIFLAFSLSLLYSSFQVGDTLTITAYKVGPFAGWEKTKAMCVNVTPHTYILTEEVHFPIKKIKGVRNKGVFGITNDGVLYQNPSFTDVWNVVEPSNLTLPPINDFDVKVVSTSIYHILAATSRGFYYASSNNLSTWYDKTANFEFLEGDNNILKVGASPILNASSYKVYFATSKGMYVTSATSLGGPSSSWQKLSPVYVGEDFEGYSIGTNIWGGVVDTFRTSDGVLVKGLKFDSVSSVYSPINYNSPSYDFIHTFSLYVDTVYNDSLNIPNFRIDYIKQDSLGNKYSAFYIEFKDGFVYLNTTKVGKIGFDDVYHFTVKVEKNVATLKFYSDKGVSVEPVTVNINGNVDDVFIRHNLIFGLTPTYIFLDNYKVLPLRVVSIYGHRSKRDYVFYLLPNNLLFYDNTSGNWVNVWSLKPSMGEFKSVEVSQVYDSLLYVAYQKGDSFSIYKLEDTDGTYSNVIKTNIFSDEGTFLSFSIDPITSKHILLSYLDKNSVPKVLHSTDGGSSFSDFTQGFSSSALYLWAAHVNSFFLADTITFYAGTEEGFFKFDDSLGAWKEVNSGLSGLVFNFVSQTQVDTFSKLIENLFPWDKFFSNTDGLGPLGENLDNDDKIVVFLYRNGYIAGSKRRYTVSYYYSKSLNDFNKMEIVTINPYYYNTSPLDAPIAYQRDLGDSSVVGLFAQAMGGLHLITYDPDEPIYLKVGADLIGYHIYKTGSIKGINSDDVFEIPVKDQFSKFISEDWETEKSFAFPFIYYLVEIDTTGNTLRQWWKENKKGERGLTGLVKFVRTDLDTAKYFVDVLYKALTGKFTHVKFKPSTWSGDFFIPAHYYSLLDGLLYDEVPSFSVLAFKAKNPLDTIPLPFIKFKGTLNNGFAVFSLGESSYNEILPPREGEYTIPDNDSIKFFMVVYDDGETGGPDLPQVRVGVGVDTMPPSVFTGIFHNSLLSYRVKLFILAEKLLFPDDPGTFGPLVLNIAGTDTTVISEFTYIPDTIYFYIDSLPHTYIYDFPLNFSNGKSKVIIKASDNIGNDISDIVYDFNEWVTQPGVFSFYDNELIMEVPTGAFGTQKKVIVMRGNVFTKNNIIETTAPSFVIGSDELYSSKPVKVKIKYPGKGELYHYVDGMWMKVKGSLDKKGYYVFETNNFGIFTFTKAGTNIPKLRLSFSLSSNILKKDGKLFTKIMLPEDRNVELKLFDTSGRVNEVIYRGKLTSGLHIFEIDGSKMKTGIYFLLFKAGSYSAKSKIVYIK